MTMMLILVRLFLNALAVMVVTYLVPGVIVSDFPHALIAALVLGIINSLIRPMLTLLSFPVTILTLGFFTLIINAFLFWLGSELVPGFQIQGFAAAFWGGLVFWAVSWASNSLVVKRLENRS